MNVNFIKKIKKIHLLICEIFKIIYYKIKYLKPDKQRLIILDDIFPWLLTAFRITEFNAYLDYFKNSEVYSSDPNFEIHKKEYLRYYPKNKNRIFKFNKNINFSAKLAYIVFINNAFNFLHVIEKYKIPFVLELYPGGGFHIDNEISDHKLKTVFDSSFLRKIIVTQKITYKYLLDRNLCSLDKIEFIYGGVLPLKYYMKNKIQKKYYKTDKPTFDICFVANKYTNQGKDKGYDVFIAVAKILSKKYSDIFSHIVGNFKETDINVKNISSKIRFYGRQNSDFFSDFYSQMDIILSPNQPFIIAKGAFDGFPTGCCVEASACGCVMFVTDCLNLNVGYKNEEDIVIISKNVDDIVEKIEYYYRNYTRLYEISKNGKKATNALFNEDVQVQRRLKIIDKICNEFIAL